MIRKIVVDTDVILDLLQERSPFCNDSVKIFTLIEQGRIQGYVSPLIFSNLFYILRKYKDAAFAKSVLLRLKLLLKIITVNEKIIGLALSSTFKDFEDAIQYYSALEHNIPCLVTRNIKDYTGEDLFVLTPVDFLDIVMASRKK